MLHLKNITKTYTLGNNKYHALNGVNINFSENEFISILGTSGSGKTTLLNIIGGLDSYTQGDMIVNGTSTKNFTSKDWDSYRNATIGFIFQNYNLINHLTVLENVKMALSISGVSNKESHKRAIQALKDVQLEQHINKKPTQLSGGQMQRVAIARALVTNPQIILADEPTGALDSKTSIQIMELIKNISKNKLVIMVTHNPELAMEYSDRIIKVSDGKVIEDSKKTTTTLNNQTYKPAKTSMSFMQAISSSFKNLLTKKTRTFLTTFAASIGIISVALVLAISNGMNNYIETTQANTLSTMPITISANETSLSIGNLNSRNNTGNIDEIKLSNRMQTRKNNYTENVLDNNVNFINYIQNNASQYYKSINFNSGYNLKALIKNDNNQINQITESTTFSLLSTNTNFAVLPEDESIINDRYTIIASKDELFKYPSDNQAILFVNYDGTLLESQMKMLGYENTDSIKLDDLIGKQFKILTNDQYFQKINNVFIPNSINEKLYNEATTLEIVAVMKPKDATATMFNGTVGYTQAFLDNLLSHEQTSEVITTLKANPTKNIFPSTNDTLDTVSYDTLLQQFGGNNNPVSINIYAKSFDDRENILKTINSFNDEVAKKYGENSDEYEKYAITYTDIAKNLTSSFNDIINSITFILTAFSAISLIVSSVMIGILTYVSVVERTKEIGILRAIGARKKDISRIFNSEATLLGLSAGILGVGIAIILTYPINNLIASSLNVTGFNAQLPIDITLILISLSIFLTFIAGYIPSKIASRKNPVEALRSE